ncbi:MAG: hypothetical protein ACUVXI_10205 [bacterium]
MDLNRSFIDVMELEDTTEEGRELIAAARDVIRRYQVGREGRDSEAEHRLRQELTAVYWDIVYHILDMRLAEAGDNFDGSQFTEAERLLLNYGLLDPSLIEEGSKLLELIGEDLGRVPRESEFKVMYVSEWLGLVYDRFFGIDKKLDERKEAVENEYKSMKSRSERISKWTDRLQSLLDKLIIGRGDYVQNLFLTANKLDSIFRPYYELRAKIQEGKHTTAEEKRKVISLEDELNAAWEERRAALAKISNIGAVNLLKWEDALKASDPEMERLENEVMQMTQEIAQLEAFLASAEGHNEATRKMFAKELSEKRSALEKKRADLENKRRSGSIEKTEEEILEILGENRNEWRSKPIDRKVEAIVNAIARLDRERESTMVKLIDAEAQKESLTEETREHEERMRAIDIAQKQKQMRECLAKNAEIVRLMAKKARIDVGPVLIEGWKFNNKEDILRVINEVVEADPKIFKQKRVNLQGLPLFLMIPGGGDAMYDWENNTIIIPMISPRSGTESIIKGLVDYRLDCDEEHELRDTYATETKQMRLGIAQLKDRISKDYTLYVMKEAKGYKVLDKEVRKWFQWYIAPSKQEKEEMAEEEVAETPKPQAEEVAVEEEPKKPTPEELERQRIAELKRKFVERRRTIYENLQKDLKLANAESKVVISLADNNIDERRIDITMKNLSGEDLRNIMISFVKQMKEGEFTRLFRLE